MLRPLSSRPTWKEVLGLSLLLSSKKELCALVMFLLQEKLTVKYELSLIPTMAKLDLKKLDQVGRFKLLGSKEFLRPEIHWLLWMTSKRLGHWQKVVNVFLERGHRPFTKMGS
mmetsp:Transcript_3274/g.9400  ORF Transcript_3274/g.9400 Transcript_3274/m.9400 type:complete len:113 (+) Transcript_3274:1180-1518(+)